jgi:hypothetical protein
MKVQTIVITIHTSGDAFGSGRFYHELYRILRKVTRKVRGIRSRVSNCLCTAPEADDVLLDVYGNTVGTIQVIGK